MFFSVKHVEFEMAVLKQRKIDGERHVFQDKWTDQYFLHSTEKEFLCVSFVLKQHRVFLQTWIVS